MGVDTAKGDDVRRLLLLVLCPTGVVDLGEDAKVAGSDDEYPVGRYHVVESLATDVALLAWEPNISWTGSLASDSMAARLLYKEAAVPFEALAGDPVPK